MTDLSRSLLVVVGGFLGAGKTTTILHAAKYLRAAGHRVAIIINDQASELVDTAVSRQVSDAVVEIPDGCFCCRFDAFQQTLHDLTRTVAPEIVLAEAVGSCTDLAATVYQPLRQLGSVAVDLGPLTVVVDGLRLRDVIHAPELLRFPATVSYLFERQLAEADAILLNKADLLMPAERSEMLGHLVARYPGVPVWPTSATIGEGLNPWLDLFVATERAGDRVLDLDYDRYADAEARLGWLNLRGSLLLGDTGSATDWLRILLEEVAERVRSSGAEIAHVKAWVDALGGSARGHLVAADRPPTIIVNGSPSHEGHVLINARVAAVPESLQAWIEVAVQRASDRVGTPFQVSSGSAFSPARPVPTHRLLPLPR